jgi:hypothetical protein
MASKIYLVFLNGLNYAIWAPDMETLLKRKGLWQYTKTAIPYLKDDQTKFVVDGKKDEVVGIITTDLSWEICFHIFFLFSLKHHPLCIACLKLCFN